MLARMFPNVYEGWLVAASGGFIIILTTAVFVHAFGTIFNPLRDEFGWSATSVSLAFSLRSEAASIAAPAVGVLLDRFGPRRLLVGGLFLASGGVFMMSFIQQLWHFYLAIMIIAAGHSGASGVSGYKATATWFERRRSRAMALVSVGAGLSGILVVGAGWLVDEIGWRAALRILAVIALAVALYPALNVRERPANHRQPVDGIDPAAEGSEGGHVASSDWGVPVRRALRSRSFWTLNLGIALLGFGSLALLVHLIPFVESLGYSKTLASTTLAVFTVTTILGRVGAGILGDIYQKRILMAAAVLIMAAGLPLLAIAGQLWHVIIGLLIIAVGFGSTLPLRQAIMADYFGTRYFGTLNGFTQVSFMIGALAGPLFVGKALDASGGYTLGWLVSGLVVSLSAIAMWAARADTRLITEHRALALADGEPIE